MKHLYTTLFCITLTGSALGQIWTVYDSATYNVPNNWVEELAYDGSNSITWTGFWADGLLRFDGTNWTNFNMGNSAIPDNNVRSLAVASNGDVWVGTTSGLGQYNGATWTVYNTGNCNIPNDNIRATVVGTNDTVWVGTGGGASKFDGTTWTNYNTGNSGIGGDQVRGIGFDNLGNTWFGTENDVSVLNSGNWTNYNSGNSNLPAGTIFRKVTVDASDNVWVGSQGGGLCMWDGSAWTIYNTGNSNIPSDVVHHVNIDPSGAKWVATDGGLCHFDGVTWTIYNSANSGMPVDISTSLSRESATALWIGTGGGGVVRMDTLIMGVHYTDPVAISLSAYPNPVAELLTLEYELLTDGNTTIEILDAQGRLIDLMTTTRSSAGTNQQQISVGNLANGNYLIRVRTAAGIGTEQITVTH